MDNSPLISLLSTFSHPSSSSRKQEVPTLQLHDLIKFYEMPFFILFMKYVGVIKHAIGF